MNRRHIALAALLPSLYMPWAGASRLLGNRPYVKSDVFGVFYARCIPLTDTESDDRGRTEIFRVRKEDDELIDRYDWYNRNGLLMGWSPIDGKVAVMRLRQNQNLPRERQVEFSFYLGGKLLKSYTTADLQKLGAAVEKVWMEAGEQAVYKVLGAEQVGLTNDRVFVVQVGETRHGFDITTGLPYKEAKK